MLRKVRPVNEQFARAPDCREYKLGNNKGDFQDQSTHVLRFWKNTDVQGRPQVFTGSQSIANLSFWTVFKGACSLNRFSECIEV